MAASQVEVKIRYINAPHLVDQTKRVSFCCKTLALLYVLLPSSKPVDYCVVEKTIVGLDSGENLALKLLCKVFGAYVGLCVVGVIVLGLFIKKGAS